MADLIPVHYHLLPRTTGTDVIYPDGLMLWDVNNKVIVAGDGVTPGGVVLGAAGTPGADGTGIRPRGLHSMSVAYLEHDAVSKDGSFWRAKQDHIGQLPPTLPTQENAYWDIIIERGPQGVQGPAGADGVNGADGADGAPFVYDDFTPEQLALLVGPQGPQGPAGADGVNGTSSYTYIAYASDDEGTGFNLTPSAALPYRAEIVSATALTPPTSADFASAVWVKYLGTDGVDEDMLIQNYAPTDATIELSPDTNIYTITVSSATTFVFDTTALNLVAGQACTFELDLTMSTVSTLTFPASVSWIYGAPYMGDAGKIYRLVFHSMDQGASWHANLAFERSIA